MKLFRRLLYKNFLSAAARQSIYTGNKALWVIQTRKLEFFTLSWESKQALTNDRKSNFGLCVCHGKLDVFTVTKINQK